MRVADGNGSRQSDDDDVEEQGAEASEYDEMEYDSDVLERDVKRRI